MKTLYLLRHAKSVAGSGDDHGRTLAKRGVAACESIGRHFSEKKILPELILCSTAARARETLNGIAAAAGWAAETPPAEITRHLYMASGGEILTIIRTTNDERGSLMLVGHNPGTEEIARALVGGGEPEALAAFAGKYATGALATIVFDAARWSEVGPGMGRLTEFVKPRSLASP